MAEIALPACTISGVSMRVDDAGRVIYESAYGPNDYIAGPAWTRLVGTITFAPMSQAEGDALTGFLLDLNGDSPVDHVMVPLWRDASRSDGEGVFPGGTTFNLTSIVDAGTDESTLTFGWDLAAGATTDQIAFNVGSMLTVAGTLVRMRTASVDVAGKTATGRMFPRVAAATSGTVGEAEVKARVLASAQLLAKSGPVPARDAITLPWRQIP